MAPGGLSTPSDGPPPEGIEIRGLRVFGRHGVLPAEEAEGQPFVVDVWCDVGLAEAAATDDLATTVDYAALARDIAAAVSGTRYRLIEALAGRICDIALSRPRVRAVTVRVAKPRAPLHLDHDDVAVVVHRARS